MLGTVVLDACAGRALRKRPASVRIADVLDCIGAFRHGDAVYLTFRASDGGQYAVATGVARCDAKTLRARISRTQDTVAHLIAGDVAADNVVIREEDVTPLWPARSVQASQ